MRSLHDLERSGRVFRAGSRPVERLDMSLDRWHVIGTRIIEIAAVAILIFLLFSAISFLCLRPTLLEARSNIHSEWQNYLRELRERNELLPGLLESVKNFQPGLSKTTDRIVEARSAINRSNTPDVVIPAVDKLEIHLGTIESIISEKTELMKNSLFAQQWQNLARRNQQIAIARSRYISHVRTYNSLLGVFPQNVFSSLFGYVRATEYSGPKNTENL